MHDSDVIDEVSLDIKDLLRILRKRCILILSVFGVAVIGATVISFLLPKLYQAETTLRIKQSKGLGQSLLAELPMGNPMATKQQMSTYAEIIKSRTVVEDVIQQIQPGRDKKKKLDYETILGRLTVSPVRDTEILKIQVVGPTPDETQKLANLIVDSFLMRIATLARSEQTLVREFISGRLQEAKTELAQSEKMLQDYKSQQKIVAPAEETKVLVDQLAEISKLVAENNIELASTQARLDNANLQLNSQKPSFIAENFLIQQCKSKLVELEVELVGMLKKYTENHPQVQALRASISETKKKLNNEIDRVVNAETASLNPIHQGLYQAKLMAEAELTALNAQKEALDAIMTQEEKALVTLPIKEQGLARVMRDAMLAQDIYIMLAKRHEEARISEVMQPTDVQIIDRAVAPDPDKPIKPQKRMNVLIGAFLGLLVGIGAAFILEYLNQTIVDSDDVRYYLDLPILGSIPAFDTTSLSMAHRRGFKPKTNILTGT
ncbi:MAG TPA: GumC family protein [Bacillota bacterium]|nr:GumC family protein [Bacillota bacterium]